MSQGRSKEELQLKLKRLRDKLEDLEETFTFNLTNTSAHLSSAAVADHESEIQELKAEIADLEAELARLG